MAFKRKRSDSELFAAFNSPARSDSSMESFDSPVSPSPMYPRAYVTPSHLPSRTMKRSRDNRPSENQIHQRTLNMLYSAQHKTEHAVGQADDPSPSPFPAPAAARNTQKSLHSFWAIKSAPPSLDPSSSAPSVDRALLSPITCEDCGAGLSSSDGAADGMEIDDACTYVAGFSEADRSCGACGRHVCSRCSITNLGAQRRCLQCAGPTPWGARSGSGLMTSSMRFF